MTIKDFFQTLKDSGRLSGSKEEIAYDLCTSSGMNYSQEAIRKWMKGKSMPRRSKLSMDNDAIILYFEKNTKSTWRNMQEKFSEIDEHNFINHSTKNPIIFYRSLLALLYDVFRLVPNSLSHILPGTSPVFGREKELNRIAEIFTTSNYAIITGIGGIGKSYIALAYAHSLYKEDGWIIQHIICEDSDTLQTSVNKLQFDNLSMNINKNPNNKEKDFNYIINKLKDCITPTLIVLDNFNHPLTLNERKAFEKLINCGQHIHFLITSRNTLKQDKQHVVYTPPLDDASLLTLYKYHRFKDFEEHKSYFDSHENILNKLFTLVEKHTLMITLLAKLPERCSINEDSIYALLNDNLSFPSESVNIAKDGVYIEDSINIILEKVFDISQLSDIEKSIMRYMSLMPLAGVDTDCFEELTTYSSNDIRSLANSCWIIRDEETFVIRLHPLVYNTIHKLDDTKPSKELLTEFGKCVKTKRELFPEDSYEWRIYNRIAASCLSVYYNIHIKNLFNKYLDSIKYDIKDEIKKKLKFDPKKGSKNELINKLTQSKPTDEIYAEIINALIDKLETISINELTDSLLDKLINDSIKESINALSFINEYLTNYSEGKYQI